MYQLKRKSTKIFMLALKAIGNMEEGCVEYPMQNWFTIPKFEIHPDYPNSKE